ncbi:hypothetical protein CYMTET_31977, partial [Cymbomonas tetramitiformis]
VRLLEKGAIDGKPPLATPGGFSSRSLGASTNTALVNSEENGQQQLREALVDTDVRIILLGTKVVRLEQPFSLPDISSEVLIAGDCEADYCELDGGRHFGAAPLFKLVQGGGLSLRGLLIHSFFSTTQGSVIASFLGSDIVISDSILTNNAAMDGSVLFMESMAGNVIISQSVFSNNTASR